MPTLSQLILYPVKSCAGMAVSAASVTPHGLVVDGVSDRQWMVVSPDGHFLTQREHPRLVLARPALRAGALELSAPGLPVLSLPLETGHHAQATVRHVQLWDDRLPALDCGDDAARWFESLIGAPCRLVRFHPGAQRHASTRWTGGLEVPTRFSDGYPFLVIGNASLDDLNRRLREAGREALPMDRFRPNVVVDGMDPFDEDYAAALAAGPVVLRPVKPCPRCPIPAVDQQTGVPGPDPLDILSTYRANPRLEGAACFGMNAILVEGEGRTLAVDQPVQVTLDFPPL